MKYIKNPVIVDAVQWVGNNRNEIEDFAGEYCDFVNNSFLFVFSPEGTIRASEGDYIIKNSNGGFYTCKPDVFKLNYKQLN